MTGEKRNKEIPCYDIYGNCHHGIPDGEHDIIFGHKKHPVTFYGHRVFSYTF